MNPNTPESEPTVRGILEDAGATFEGIPSGTGGWITVRCPWHHGRAFFHPGFDLFHCYRIGSCPTATRAHALDAQELLNAVA